MATAAAPRRRGQRSFDGASDQTPTYVRRNAACDSRHTPATSEALSLGCEQPAAIAREFRGRQAYRRDFGEGGAERITRRLLAGILSASLIVSAYWRKESSWQKSLLRRYRQLFSS